MGREIYFHFWNIYFFFFFFSFFFFFFYWKNYQNERLGGLINVYYGKRRAII